ncbi:hypothetical protein Tco_0827173 [Tanacetum coccineum]
MLQKLASQLELLDKKLSQEDVNQKLLRSLSPEWNTHAVVWRNTANLDTMSMDDLYNNLKVYKPEVKGMSSSNSSTQNMAFSDQAEEGPNYALMAFSSSSPDSELIECQIVDNYKKGLGCENYNVVPPPYIGNFMPPTPNLSFIGLDEFVNKHVFENCKAMSSEEEPKVVRKNDDALCIEEWVSDDEGLMRKEDVSHS